MKRLAHCAHRVLPARHAKGGRATRPHCHHYHGRGATRRCDSLLQLTASQTKTPTAQRTLSSAHTFGKRQELQPVQRSDTVGGITRSKRSRHAMSRCQWKEQCRDQDAAKSLQHGATEVRVGSRAEAEELLLGRYQSQGYRNVTGMSPRETKEFFGGKSGVYHRDTGRGNYPHGADHLQIHTFEGNVVRIYFP